MELPPLGSPLEALSRGALHHIGGRTGNFNNKNVQQNSMSWDGSTIAFMGKAENLVPGSGTLWFDRVLVRVCDLAGGVTYCYPTKSPLDTPSVCIRQAPGGENTWIASGSDATLSAGDSVYIQS